MADHSTIEWTDATWNPITGCSVVSPGCTNCYAMKLAGTRLRHHPSRAGLTDDSRAGPVWNGKVRFNEEWLDQPLRWRKPRMIFVCAHGDLFHENVPDEWIDRVFAVMALAPQHTFQVLTKRAARMQEYLTGRTIRPSTSNELTRLASLFDAADQITGYGPWATFDLPLPNVWLGVSVEDQSRADERIPDLLATPAAVRFVSAEPLIGPVSLIDRDPIKLAHGVDAKPEHRVYVSLLRGWGLGPYALPGLDWVIVGGESGPGARPMHPGWARSLRDQCRAAGVPFFFKQWGEWSGRIWRKRNAKIILNDGRVLNSTMDVTKPEDRSNWAQFEPHLIRRVGKKAAGRKLDGQTWDQMPEVKP